MIHSTPDRSTSHDRVTAELTLARYLGQDFRGHDLRAAILGLPLVLDFLSMQSPDDPTFAWDRFDPRAYVALVRDLEDAEASFLKALLAESLVFFDYLVDSGEVGPTQAALVQTEIGHALDALSD